MTPRNRLARLFFVASMAAYSELAASFELPTHGAMTAMGVAQSRLSAGSISSEVIRQLGLVDFTTGFGSLYPPLGVHYLDIGTSLTVRQGKAI